MNTQPEVIRGFMAAINNTKDRAAGGSVVTWDILKSRRQESILERCG